MYTWKGVGGWTNPYGGNQPWTVEPVPAYFGTGNDYTVTQFSAVRLTGLPLSDLSSQALGLYLPVDKDGDGVADVLDGRPIYVQRDAMTTAQIALGANNVGRVAPGNEVEQGVRVGRFYLYYRYSLGGWAVHPTIGSEQVSEMCGFTYESRKNTEGWRLPEVLFFLSSLTPGTLPPPPRALFPCCLGVYFWKKKKGDAVLQHRRGVRPRAGRAADVAAGRGRQL